MRALFVLTVLMSSPAFAADAGVKGPVFVAVEVLEVVDTEDGIAVLLLQKEAGVVLPILIGPAEANAIKMRLEKSRPPRPMTHDLLEDVITAMGAKLLRVEIDDLKANTFLGRLVLEQRKKVTTLDARPSDSIALALGLGAPILVAQPVLERAGLPLKGKKPARKHPVPETL
ncbi:MAG: DUF151 domain-containing protein [Archangium sp.]|nr:DUF151 domain-containing protein [Archangium sp.]